MKKFSSEEMAAYTGIPATTLREFQHLRKPAKKTVKRIMDVMQKHCQIIELTRSVISSTKKTDGDAPKPKPSAPTTKTGKATGKPQPTGKLSNKEIKFRLEKMDIERCPECGGELVIQYSKAKDNQFVGCANWQTNGCKWTKTLV